MNSITSVPHPVQRIASALAEMLNRHGVRLTRTELLDSFRFWAEPEGSLWIRRRRDGVEISLHRFIVECCAEQVRKNFIDSHTTAETGRNKPNNIVDSGDPAERNQ
jgi:hypothetical protein